MKDFLANLATGAANKALVGAATAGAAAVAAPSLTDVIDAITTLLGVPPESARAITVIASAVVGLLGVYAIPNRRG